MKNIIPLLIAIQLITHFCIAQISHDDLMKGFQNPPEEARLSTEPGQTGPLLTEVTPGSGLNEPETPTASQAFFVASCSAEQGPNKSPAA